MRESIYGQMTKSEREVADILKKLGISWLYEQPVFVWDEHKRPRVWAPDFYLKHLGIYIEVCGSEKFDYEYRRRIFDNNGYRVIFLHLYKKPDKWGNHLVRYLRLYTRYRNHKLGEILNKEN